MSEGRTFLLDLFFPRRCLGCGQLLADLAGRQVCATCFASIPLKKEFNCAFCSAPVVAGKTCPFCRKDHSLDCLLVATSYEEPLVERMLKTMKYRLVSSLTDDIAELMIKYLEKNVFKSLNIETCSVVPVPLHRRRLNWRGFNQAEALAEKIAAPFGWPLETKILKRLRHHPPQAKIKSRTERIQRMNGMFACAESETVANHTVLLVDDISTTGSTLNDCARALKSAGAKAVIGLVFARGR